MEFSHNLRGFRSRVKVVACRVQRVAMQVRQQWRPINITVASLRRRRDLTRRCRLRPQNKPPSLTVRIRVGVID